MNLSSKKTIKELLQEYQTKPIKRLGQNFLVDKKIITKITETADLKPDDTILEVGPGIGTLTQEIAKRAGKIIVVEKDPKMVEILKETLENYNNVEIIQGDILKIKNLFCKIRCATISQNEKVKSQNYKIVANLPFYLTAPVIRQFLESAENYPPQIMVLIVQKEVAQRICAKPPKMSILAVSVQFYAEVKIISYISKKSFWPQPKVDSAIIKIIPRSLTEVPLQGCNPCQSYRGATPISLCQFREQFFKIVKAGFSQPRKQLANNLSKKLKIDKIKIIEWLLKNNIQPTQRAETLTIEDWLKLTKHLK